MGELGAGKQIHAPPRFVYDYAAFARALAGRYGPGGAFWRSRPDLTATPVNTYEIWNEPDNGAFWRPGPDAARYDAMYLAARNAIKDVDPRARVIVGGLTAPSTFLPAMVAARTGIGAHIDGVAIHPYGPTPAGVLADVRDARNVLARLGLTRTPLYVTEFGWSTQPPGTITYLPERLRPSYISATLVALARADCGVAATTLYTWVTPEHHRSNRDDWFGIQPPRGGTSPDVTAFAAALKIASSPGPPLPVCGLGLRSEEERRWAQPERAQCRAELLLRLQLSSASAERLNAENAGLALRRPLELSRNKPA